MSLTDDWKTGKLKNGWYFCLYENDAVFPALCFDDDFEDYELKVMEVLAPCDYDHFVELNEKVKEENKQLRQLLERGAQLLSFEHEEYEVMSFVSEVNEVLK